MGTVKPTNGQQAVIKADERCGVKKLGLWSNKTPLP